MVSVTQNDKKDTLLFFCQSKSQLPKLVLKLNKGSRSQPSRYSSVKKQSSLIAIVDGINNSECNDQSDTLLPFCQSRSQNIEIGPKVKQRQSIVTKAAVLKVVAQLVERRPRDPMRIP